MKRLFKQISLGGCFLTAFLFTQGLARAPEGNSSLSCEIIPLKLMPSEDINKIFEFSAQTLQTLEEPSIFDDPELLKQMDKEKQEMEQAIAQYFKKDIQKREDDEQKPANFYDTLNDLPKNVNLTEPIHQDYSKLSRKEADELFEKLLSEGKNPPEALLAHLDKLNNPKEPKEPAEEKLAGPQDDKKVEVAEADPNLPEPVVPEKEDSPVEFYTPPRSAPIASVVVDEMSKKKEDDEKPIEFHTKIVKQIKKWASPYVAGKNLFEPFAKNFVPQSTSMNPSHTPPASSGRVPASLFNLFVSQETNPVAATQNERQPLSMEKPSESLGLDRSGNLVFSEASENSISGAVSAQESESSSSKSPMELANYVLESSLAHESFNPELLKQNETLIQGIDMNEKEVALPIIPAENLELSLHHSGSVETDRSFGLRPQDDKNGGLKMTQTKVDERSSSLVVEPELRLAPSKARGLAKDLRKMPTSSSQSSEPEIPWGLLSALAAFAAGWTGRKYLNFFS